jgi:hypothetical protein
MIQARSRAWATRQHRTRPCRKRKDGAPTLSKRKTKWRTKPGYPGRRFPGFRTNEDWLTCGLFPGFFVKCCPREIPPPAASPPPLKPGVYTKTRAFGMTPWMNAEVQIDCTAKAPLKPKAGLNGPPRRKTAERSFPRYLRPPRLSSLSQLALSGRHRFLCR